MAAPKVYRHSLLGAEVGGQVPCCYARRSTNQTFSANTWDAVDFENTIYCTGSMWTSTDPDAVYIPVNGLYLCVFEYTVVGTAGSYVDLRIASTGSVAADRAYTTVTCRGGDGAAYGQITSLGYYKKSDSVYAAIFPSTNSATYSGSTYAGLSVTYIGGLAV